MLTKSNSELYVNGKLQKKRLSWVSIRDGYLYISRDNNRSYWVLKKMDKNKRPKIHFSDKKRTFRIASNKIVIHNENDYIKARDLLKPWIE